MKQWIILASATAVAACATADAPMAPIEVAAAEMDERIDGDTQKYRGFDGVLPQVGQPVAISVQISPNLAYLIDNRGPQNGYSGLNDGFGSGGNLGERDVARLVAEVQDEIMDEFAKRGVPYDAGAATVLQITLTDLAPNRPTFGQLSSEPSQSFQSFGRGGMSAEGVLLSASGEALGEFTYGDYTDFIEDAPFRGTWTDANRAISLMARHVAKRLA